MSLPYDFYDLAVFYLLEDDEEDEMELRRRGFFDDQDEILPPQVIPSQAPLHPPRLSLG